MDRRLQFWKMKGWKIDRKENNNLETLPEVEICIYRLGMDLGDQMEQNAMVTATLGH